MDKRGLLTLAKAAKEASYQLLNESSKNKFLKKLAENIRNSKKIVLEANQQDLRNAEALKLDAPLLDRLKLTEDRIEAIAQGVDEIVELPDPVGHIIESSIRPNGIRIDKVSVPIGVIGIIYESRPNVTIDCAALCFKSGNACILRGGKEAFHTNQAFASIIESTLKGEDIDPALIQLVPSPDRALLKDMLHMDEYIDCIIPRGGEALIRFVAEESRIPVIKHYKGVCSVYVDRSATHTMAKTIVLNAKCQRPGVCNAIENLFIDEKYDNKALLNLLKALADAGVELRVDDKIKSILDCADIHSLPASEDDFYEEFLALILAVKFVSGVEDAVRVVNKYGSKHSEAIVAQDAKTAEYFLNNVDASTVYWNASTRFTDGGAFGLGAEIGISTDKLHARGPMGLRELCTYKYQVFGSGQIR